MLRLFCILLFLAIGLHIGSNYSEQQGYVSIFIPFDSAQETGYMLTMSVVTLVIAIIILLVIFLLVETILRKGLSSFKGILNWFSFRKKTLAQDNFNQGLNSLLAGEWIKAEKKLTQYATYHSDPSLCYLLASEAAHQQQKDLLRTKYIDLSKQEGGHELAPIVTQARQLISLSRYNEAHTILQTLNKKYHKNPAILQLLKTIYLSLSMWEELEQLLPNLKKGKLVSEQEYLYLLQQTHLGLLDKPYLPSELLTHWHMLPKNLKNDPVMIEGMIKRSLPFQDKPQINDTIISLVSQNPSETALSILTNVDLIDLKSAIRIVKKLTHKQPENAQAFSVLGQLYRKSEQWEDAQQALETALSQRVDYQDYAYLADVLEHQGNQQAADGVSKQAFKLMTNISQP